MDGEQHHVGTKLLALLMHHFPEYSRAGTHRLPRSARALKAVEKYHPRQSKQSISAGRVGSFVSGLDRQTFPVNGPLPSVGSGHTLSSRRVDGSPVSLHFYSGTNARSNTGLQDTYVILDTQWMPYLPKLVTALAIGTHTTKHLGASWHPSLYHEVKHSSNRLGLEDGRGSAARSMEMDVVSSSTRQEQIVCSRLPCNSGTCKSGDQWGSNTPPVVSWSVSLATIEKDHSHSNARSVYG